ncbi:plasmid mobilization relaxosome protein MobC [Olivibacter sp. 47]|jgi:predicted transglutaminase-like cysteine proteinase|uniref:plasmid mobilization protein n=1 Tax=Olivibacter sp. 47 TaxID=3056486 RepID=UPI0025A34649|nr:plasmid mobilization relaxosome protein MobC [Olivibacter sp. 47]MDM8175938.1 plasmid mobilization relaxosome protein MobC [Olivibacter sp. 47]
MEGKENIRSRIVGLRLTIKEYDRIKALSKESTTPQLSEYIRRVIFEKPVTFFTRDRSMDELMQELMLLRKELNSIGINFNQAVKKLNALDRTGELKSWATSYEMDRRQLLRQIENIAAVVAKMGGKWLQ